MTSLVAVKRNIIRAIVNASSVNIWGGFTGERYTVLPDRVDLIMSVANATSKTIEPYKDYDTVEEGTGKDVGALYFHAELTDFE